MRFPPASRAAVALLLLSSLILGLAQAALMPPFEGFDEHGHYSYIQQVAETGHWPRLNERMSKDVDDYLALAPGPDSIPRQWSHHDFFQAQPGVIAAARDAIQSPRAAPRGVDAGADRELAGAASAALLLRSRAGLSRHQVAELCRPAVCAARVLLPDRLDRPVRHGGCGAARKNTGARRVAADVCDRRMAADLSDVVSRDGAARQRQPDHGVRGVHRGSRLARQHRRRAAPLPAARRRARTGAAHQGDVSSRDGRDPAHARRAGIAAERVGAAQPHHRRVHRRRGRARHLRLVVPVQARRNRKPDRLLRRHAHACGGRPDRGPDAECKSDRPPRDHAVDLRGHFPLVRLMVVRGAAAHRAAAAGGSRARDRIRRIPRAATPRGSSGRRLHAAHRGAVSRRAHLSFGRRAQQRERDVAGVVPAFARADPGAARRLRDLRADAACMVQGAVWPC